MSYDGTTELCQKKKPDSFANKIISLDTQGTLNISQ